MNYCSHCGCGVELKIPAGDNLPRHVCSSCGQIHYLNPRVIVGCLPVWEDRILICKRAIEPRHGYWTLPAGFMENDESAGEAAARETLEEAGARIELLGAFSMISVPYVNQVHVFYRARLLDLDFKPGVESLEVALFEEAKLPWKDIAFRTVGLTLKHWLADRKRGSFGFHAEDLK